MTRQPWIIRFRRGWCALPIGHVPDSAAISDKTVCGYHISFRYEEKRGVPTCQECLAILSPTAQPSRFQAYSIDLWRDTTARECILHEAERDFERWIEETYPGSITTRSVRQISFQRLTTDDSECGMLPSTAEAADLVFVRWSSVVTKAL